MAKTTERIRLSVHMLNATLRHPVVLASQLAVAQAASRGRLEVGLGAGAKYWAPFDNRPLGIPFPSHATRIARLEALCRTLPALWRGETVSDEVLGLREVSFGHLGVEPPSLVLGGRSEGVLTLAARYADGWDAVDSEPDKFEQLARRLAGVCHAVGRRVRSTKPSRSGCQRSLIQTRAPCCAGTKMWGARRRSSSCTASVAPIRCGGSRTRSSESSSRGYRTPV